MDFIEILFVLFLIIYLILLLLILVSDGDLSLIFWDKFGKKLDDLKGQVVWVTGASSGIGAAIAIEAAKHGAKLVISARSEDKLRTIKQRCIDVGRYHGLVDKDILVLPMDMTKFDSHQKCVEKVLHHFEKISIVIHNAGRSQRARWEHTDIQVDKDLFDLNVFGPVHLSRLIIPHFMERAGGQFAIVSSAAGKAGVPFSGSYTGSKHAINGYFNSLRTEKVGTGIKITILCPGPVFSDLLRSASTENAGEAMNSSMSSTDRRMTAERCAHLSLVAITHQLEEAWMSLFPVVPLMYFNQYFPTISFRLMSWIGPRFLLKVRDSRDDTVKKD